MVNKEKKQKKIQPYSVCTYLVAFLNEYHYYGGYLLYFNKYFWRLTREELFSNNKPRTNEIFKQGAVGTTYGYSNMKNMNFEKFRSFLRFVIFGVKCEYQKPSQV